MRYEDLVSEYGSASEAARKLGYHRQTVSKWKMKGIPFEQQFKIQLRSKGRLKADISKLAA